MRTRKEWLEWFRVDRDLPEHPKLYALAARGGWSRDKALGRLIRLWAWVAKHAANGELDAFQLQGLNNHLFDIEKMNNHNLQIATGCEESCACCQEETISAEAEAHGHSVAPFIDCGFIEVLAEGNGSGQHFRVRNWIDFNGYALRERERDRARKGLE